MRPGTDGLYLLTMDQEEYEKYVAPDIGEMKERIRLSMVRGAKNAKVLAERKKRIIERRNIWNRRREISDEYDI